MSTSPSQVQQNVPRCRLRKSRFPKHVPETDCKRQHTKVVSGIGGMIITDDLHELQRMDLPVLTVQGVAKLLHCSVDRVHRISNVELPRSLGPGKHNLYLLEYVIEFIKRRTRQAGPNAGNVSTQQRDVIDCALDSVRGRSQKRRTP